MANLPEKNVVLVDKITNVPTDSNLFINANGEFKQASVNDVVNSSTVVSTAVETAINTAVQDSIDSNFKQTSGSPILLTDSADGTLIDFKGKGRSTQKQYSGKNKLNCSLTTAITQNGITFTPVYDGKNLLYINVNGTATDNAYTTIASNVTIPSGTYILNGCPSGGGESTYRMYTNSLNYFDYGNGATFTLNAEYTFANLVIYVFKGQALNNLKFYPMIRLAGTDSTYEPYVGGTASPNPNYPQAIKSVADGGYFDGELLNGVYDATTGLHTSNSKYVCSKNAIPCKEGDIKKIIYGMTARIISFTFYDKDMNFISCNSVSGTNEHEATVPANTAYAHFSISNNSNSMTVVDAKHITVTINGKYALIVKGVEKNLLKNTATSQTINGVTFTVNEDKSVTVNGTATADSLLTLGTTTAKKGNDYRWSGCPSGGSDSTYYLYASFTIDYYNQVKDYGYGSGTGVLSGDTTFESYIMVKSGTTINATFYPMIRKAEVTDNTYEPYKETVTYIPLNEPLRSNLDGTVTDEVSLTGVTRRFKEVVFDGSDDEVIIAFGNDYPHLFRISVNGVKETRVNVICTHFLSHRKVNSDYSKNMIYTFNDHILINHMDITTVAEFKAWLQANPITVQYELAEPIIEKIEPVDIVTYDNVTYLTASDNADMELEYPTSKVAGIASIGYSKGRKAEYEVELLKAQLLELQTAMVNSL